MTSEYKHFTEPIHEGSKFNWNTTDIRLEGVEIIKETEKAYQLKWRESVKLMREGTFRTEGSTAWFPKSVISIYRRVDELTDLDEVQADIPKYIMEKLWEERKEWSDKKMAEQQSLSRYIVHYGSDGIAKCGQAPTTTGWMMSFTKDRSKVTCKKCLGVI